jgi:hypothetical protein
MHIFLHFSLWKYGVSPKFEEHIRSESSHHIIPPTFNAGRVIIPRGMTRDDSEQSGEGASFSENEIVTEGSLDKLSD